MVNGISKTVNINDLPIEIDISADDYIILQNEIKTYRVQFKDIIINKTNTTFGQEINELYSRVNELNTLVTQLQQQLSQETTRANAAEKNLESLTNSIKSELQTKINSDIASERSRVDKSVANVTSTVNQLRVDLNAEISRAKSQESNIQRELDADRNSSRVPL